MKKILFVALFVLLGCNAAWGAQVFVTTVQSTDIRQVQDVSIEYMMGRNFAVDRVEEYTLTFTKGFGDGFWLASRNMVVKFNMLARDGNVKLMVTQFENSPQAWLSGQRAIEHLIPLIRNIRHSIDGTPQDQIENEAVNQGADDSDTSPNKQKAVVKSGLSFDGLNVKSVEAGGIAEKAGLKAGDRIVEINARPADEKTLKDLDTRLASGRSVMVVYEREGKKDVATLKK